MNEAAIVVILSALAFTSCTACKESFQRAWYGYSEHCIDHVSYIQFEKGTIMKRDHMGDVVPCDMPEDKMKAVGEKQ